MDAQKRSYFVIGESRTNSDNSITRIYGSFYLAFEVDAETETVLAFNCTHTLDHGAVPAPPVRGAALSGDRPVAGAGAAEVLRRLLPQGGAGLVPGRAQALAHHAGRAGINPPPFLRKAIDRRRKVCYALCITR